MVTPARSAGGAQLPIDPPRLRQSREYPSLSWRAPLVPKAFGKSPRSGRVSPYSLLPTARGVAARNDGARPNAPIGLMRADAGLPKVGSEILKGVGKAHIANGANTFLKNAVAVRNLEIESRVSHFCCSLPSWKMGKVETASGRVCAAQDVTVLAAVAHSLALKIVNIPNENGVLRVGRVKVRPNFGARNRAVAKKVLAIPNMQLIHLKASIACGAVLGDIIPHVNR